MPVIVRYVDGDPRTYDQADSANLDSRLMRLSKWNRRTRRAEDVAVLDAQNITQAEVMESGVVKRIVVGLALKKTGT